MSKTTKKVEKQPLSLNAKKGLIITAICIIMVAVLVVSILLVLKKPENNENNNNNSSSSSSTLYIKNGDFAYFNKESATFPKSADNWTKYTYKAPETSENGTVTSHGFTQITNTEKVVAGVVDTDEEVWSTVATDLAADGIQNVANPGIHDEDLDTNVYMFATKSATTATIASASFSVASQSSAKITVWLNTAQLSEGSKATVMIQKYSSTLSAMEADRYAHSFDIAKADGWQAYEFYVFNRESGSRSVVCTVGIGNCYDGTEAEGVLFVDDIAYETVSANEYRLFVDEAEHASNYATIGTDASDDASKYSALTNIDGTDATVLSLEEYLNDAKVEDKAYSPFTKNDVFSIYKATNNGTVTAPVALVLNQWNGNEIVVKSSEDLKDHLHISFWVRVEQVNSVTAQANIALQSLKDGEWTDITNGNYSAIVTNQAIDEDNNCGWIKCDIYVKPTSVADTTVRVVYALGNVKGTATNKYVPHGSIYVTSPFVENVSADEYSKASSNTYTKKISLVGNLSSTSVTNGSFSNLATNNPSQPLNWIPVFAGDNVIYKDGKENQRPANLPTSITDVEGIVEKNSPNAPAYDDSERNILKLTNNVATAYGYLSADISISAKTVYAFSVLAKTEGDAKPYVYIVKSGAENRADAILGKIEAATATDLADDAKFAMVSSADEGDGWTRYYIIIATGDTGATIRVALFNGSIDGTTLQQGTVCYDYVAMNTLGTYTIDVAEYEEGDEDAPATNRDRIHFTASTGYTVFEDLTAEEIAAISAKSNVTVSEPDWNKIVEDALEAAKPVEEESEPAEKTPVDWALLLSVVSSIAMVGALAVVVVIRIFKKRARKNNAE